MKKYGIPSFVLVFVVLVTLGVLRQNRVSAQQAAGSVKVTPMTVTRVVLIKISPG